MMDRKLKDGVFLIQERSWDGIQESRTAPNLAKISVDSPNGVFAKRFTQIYSVGPAFNLTYLNLSLLPQEYAANLTADPGLAQELTPFGKAFG